MAQVKAASFSAIVDTLKIPIAYVTFGENIEQIDAFKSSDLDFPILLTDNG